MLFIIRTWFRFVASGMAFPGAKGRAGPIMVLSFWMTCTIMVALVSASRFLYPDVLRLGRDAAENSARPGLFNGIGLGVAAILFLTLVLVERISRGIQVGPPDDSGVRRACLLLFFFGCVLSLPALRSDAGSIFAVVLHAVFLLVALVLAPDEGQAD